MSGRTLSPKRTLLFVVHIKSLTGAEQCLTLTYVALPVTVVTHLLPFHSFSPCHLSGSTQTLAAAGRGNRDPSPLHSPRALSLPITIPFLPSISVDIANFCSTSIDASLANALPLSFITTYPITLLDEYPSLSSFLHIHSTLILISLLHPSVPLDKSIKSKAGTIISVTERLVALHTRPADSPVGEPPVTFRSQIDNLDSVGRHTLPDSNELEETNPSLSSTQLTTSPERHIFFSRPLFLLFSMLTNPKSWTTKRSTPDWNMSMPLTQSSQQKEVTYDYAPTIVLNTTQLTEGRFVSFSPFTASLLTKDPPPFDSLVRPKRFHIVRVVDRAPSLPSADPRHQNASITSSVGRSAETVSGFSSSSDCCGGDERVLQPCRRCEHVESREFHCSSRQIQPRFFKSNSHQTTSQNRLNTSDTLDTPSQSPPSRTQWPFDSPSAPSTVSPALTDFQMKQYDPISRRGSMQTPVILSPISQQMLNALLVLFSGVVEHFQKTGGLGDSQIVSLLLPFVVSPFRSVESVSKQAVMFHLLDEFRDTPSLQARDNTDILLRFLRMDNSIDNMKTRSLPPTPTTADKRLNAQGPILPVLRIKKNEDPGRASLRSLPPSTKRREDASQPLSDQPYPASLPNLLSTLVIDLVEISQLHHSFEEADETHSDPLSFFTPVAQIVSIVLEITKPIPLLHSSFKWKGQIHTSNPPLFLSTALPFLRTFLHSHLMKEEFIVLTQVEAIGTHLSTSVKPPPLFTFCSEDEEVSMEYCKLYLNVMLYGLTKKKQAVLVVDYIFRSSPERDAITRAPRHSTATHPHPYPPHALVLCSLLKLETILSKSDHVRVFFLKELPQSLVTVAQYASLRKEQTWHHGHNHSTATTDGLSSTTNEERDEELQITVGRVVHAFLEGEDEELDNDRLSVKWGTIFISSRWELSSKQPYSVPVSSTIHPRPPPGETPAPVPAPTHSEPHILPPAPSPVPDAATSAPPPTTSPTQSSPPSAAVMVLDLTQFPVRTFAPSSVHLAPMKTEYLHFLGRKRRGRRGTSILEVYEEPREYRNFAMTRLLMASPLVELKTLATDFFDLFLSSMFDTLHPMLNQLEIAGYSFKSPTEMVGMASQGFVYRRFKQILSDSVEQMNQLRNELNDPSNTLVDPDVLKGMLKSESRFRPRQAYTGI
ncbi:hypothetical protein BLNAU_13789 [Blattamonas nauphoetae]|uniref:Uncharacterized protein n=1 Tax=Blattamonas nauphoetae TaxID=2049346 RepID=A0ABQ9XIV1_9EUKA|nr:hypothetical protein BLNAU_13789 [Blattamonas nauphoetae]